MQKREDVRGRQSRDVWFVCLFVSFFVFASVLVLVCEDLSLSLSCCCCCCCCMLVSCLDLQSVSQSRLICGSQKYLKGIGVCKTRIAKGLSTNHKSQTFKVYTQTDKQTDERANTQTRKTFKISRRQAKTSDLETDRQTVTTSTKSINHNNTPLYYALKLPV